MEVISLEEAMKSLDCLIDKSCTENTMFKIKAGDRGAVLISEETYDNLLVTLEFLSTPGLLDRFQEKRSVS